jgi:hypothetical protein
MDFAQPLIVFKPAGVPLEWEWQILGSIEPGFTLEEGLAACEEAVNRHYGRPIDGRAIILPLNMINGALEVSANVFKLAKDNPDLMRHILGQDYFYNTADGAVYRRLSGLNAVKGGDA